MPHSERVVNTCDREAAALPAQTRSAAADSAIVSGVCTRKSWAKWAAAASASSRDTSPALTTASRRFSNDNLEKSKPGERELMIEHQPGVHQVQLALR